MLDSQRAAPAGKSLLDMEEAALLRMIPEKLLDFCLDTWPLAALSTSLSTLQSEGALGLLAALLVCQH